MPRSRGSLFLAFVGGLTAVFVIAAGGLYAYREFYEPAKYQYPAERYEPARDATQPIASKEHPGAQAYDPHCNQPQNHDDADLCAQWGAVRAVEETNRLTRVGLKLAAVGFWVAFLGGFFGVVGTAFLVLTFRENRRSADAAHDANRPWLQLEIMRTGALHFGPAGASIEIEVATHNRGDSPATDVLLVADLVPIRVGWWHTNTGQAVGAVRRIIHQTGPARIGGAIRFQGQTPRETVRATVSNAEILAVEVAGEAIYEVGIGVRYRFGDRIGATVQSYTITDTASPKREIYGGTDIPAQRIHLVDTNAGYAV